MLLEKKNSLIMIKNIIIRLFLIFFLFNSNSNTSAIENPTSIGVEDAKVTVKVFSSLGCPHCAHFHRNIFKKLKNDYIDTKVVRFEHHSFPLDLQSLSAEKILKCFDDNGKKFSFLHEIYEKQNTWYVGKDINTINAKISDIAKTYGMKSDKINNCLNNEDLEEEILANRIDANKKYSITSTPTLFINEKKYDGKYTYEDFKKAIEKFM